MRFSYNRIGSDALGKILIVFLKDRGLRFDPKEAALAGFPVIIQPSLNSDGEPRITLLLGNGEEVISIWLRVIL